MTVIMMQCTWHEQQKWYAGKYRRCHFFLTCTSKMFKQNFKLNGSFTAECQQNVVPHSLLALVNVILEGPNIKHQTHLVTATSITASLSISQLLMFNSVKLPRGADTSSTVHHKHERETPLPLYITMKIHSVTRSRNLIDPLFNLGMCVSYDRF